MAEARIEIHQGDITTFQVDAIVNAANKSLLGGGGVDGAIHRGAGPELKEACRELGGAETGEAKVTPGFQLPARYVIHTVGPVWKGGEQGEPELLASCYENSLKQAQAYELESVAFPSISTGAYGYPLEAAARIALLEIDRHLKENALPRRVLIVAFSPDDQQTYQRVKDSIGID
jgi:O-acetyl-ADP-ribose deacetylase (regulator of RNase III)